MCVIIKNFFVVVFYETRRFSPLTQAATKCKWFLKYMAHCVDVHQHISKHT